MAAPAVAATGGATAASRMRVACARRRMRGACARSREVTAAAVMAADGACWERWNGGDEAMSACGVFAPAWRHCQLSTLTKCSQRTKWRYTISCRTTL